MNRNRAIVLGGGVTAVLSTLPVIEAGNSCCCMWVIGGGALAAYLTWQSENAPMTVGYGGLLGFLAGLIAVPIAMMLELVFYNPAEVERMIQKSMERVPVEAMDAANPVLNLIQNPVGYAIISGFGLFMAASIFSTAGGAIVGYWKREVPAPPPYIQPVQQPAPGSLLLPDKPIFESDIPEDTHGPENPDTEGGA